MSRFEPTILGEFCSVNSGFAFKSEQFSEDSNDTFLVKGSNLGHRVIRWDEGPWWDNSDYGKLQRYQLVADDVVLAMDRPIVGSQLKFAWIKSTDPKSLLVQRVACLRAIEGSDQVFLRYVIASPAFLQYIETITTGVNVPHISGPDIRKYKFDLPIPEYRQKIAALLSAYDDLIENNLQRIKLLEEMAQITYEEWFIRMKFPGHEEADTHPETGLPEGWSCSNIGQYFDHEIGGGWGEDEPSEEFSEAAFVIRGTDFNGLSKGEIKNVPLRYHKKSNLASRKLQDGDIIFEVSGGSHNEGVAKTAVITKETFSLFGNSVMCASFCKLARPSEQKLSFYLFHFLRFLRKIKGTEVFEIRSASNIVNYNWTAFLKFQNINIPIVSLLDNFNFLMENVHKQVCQFGIQNQLLKEARDILLPRLMTGMIDIDKVELPESLLERLKSENNN